MNETTTAAVAVSGSVSEYHIGHTIYRVRTVFNPAGIVKKCAVGEYPKSEIDRYQAA